MKWDAGSTKKEETRGYFTAGVYTQSYMTPSVHVEAISLFLCWFRRFWGIQTTIMDAFVIFFLLSTTKLLSVSFALLMGTKNLHVCWKIVLT